MHSFQRRTGILLLNYPKSGQLLEAACAVQESEQVQVKMISAILRGTSGQVACDRNGKQIVQLLAWLQQAQDPLLKEPTVGRDSWLEFSDSYDKSTGQALDGKLVAQGRQEEMQYMSNLKVFREQHVR